MSSSAFDILLKLLLIGDSSVGKTCLLLRFTENTYANTFIATIGIDFKVKTVDIDGKRVKLQIWDTAGQEQYRSIQKAYYRGAAGIMLVYDSTVRSSFESIDNWMQAIEEHASESVCKCIIANKSDLADSKVTPEEGKALAQRCHARFFQCSAKTGANVDEAFMDLARLAKGRHDKRAPSLMPEPAVVVDPGQQYPEEPNGKRCC
ncbi:putative Ras-related protein RAB1BV [Paratrimastix pyriformis]|uniref:Ras-related protein RAB1BV n=1 Tax=Paratrimastix pyriformis TaxID=342808 RepID=A0ABQ8UM17_9EUKA|nr:putative Ras-related protein RAB1BV [Paratrimastix pyriformis]|eukprot:GAFH01004673.1.p1 GENE.GAFH01004673.1~~GAFH01004673.1.p1  ORF type:complete len:205 (+),score=7.97 GAFH01004673.1:34-648(+)